MDMIEEMRKYFANTPIEEIRKSWEALNHLDKNGPLVKDVLEDWMLHYSDFHLDDSFYIIETNETVNKKALEYLESFFLIYSYHGNTKSGISDRRILLRSCPN